MISLDGKWALVTGASRGIGQQIVIALAKRGCNIILHARKADNNAETLNLIKEYNIQTKNIGASLDDEEGVSSLIEFVKKEVGTVDILYNNAGIQNEWCDTFDNGMSVWKHIFQVNLFSVVQLCNALAPLMIKKGYGRIINTSSGIEGVPQMACYGAAKIAIEKFTSELAYELADTGVTITALDPGWLRTDLGGPDGEEDVETVIPGALAPLLMDIPNGSLFRAQELRTITG